ncbi:hypothetical protein TSUD_85310 [Trifolium subterraneum]|uniref:Uncharacterized protein n=1 Tax=Trifolium subterraneum TaxID=3900 RepID=A0A2Z6NS54_TRISU|nr:hypothetical protein TSUD_85310 [Trifolium subterraneum]
MLRSKEPSTESTPLAANIHSSPVSAEADNIQAQNSSASEFVDATETDSSASKANVEIDNSHNFDVDQHQSPHSEHCSGQQTLAPEKVVKDMEFFRDSWANLPEQEDIENDAISTSQIFLLML